MLSSLIVSAHSYPASTNKFITGTPGVRSFWSSRTKKKSSQCSNASTGYGPNCLTHVNSFIFIKAWTMSSSFFKLLFLKEAKGTKKELAYYTFLNQKRYLFQILLKVFKKSLYGDVFIR